MTYDVEAEARRVLAEAWPESPGVAADVFADALRAAYAAGLAAGRAAGLGEAAARVADIAEESRRLGYSEAARQGMEVAERAVRALARDGGERG